MYFVLFGYNSVTQGQLLLRDLKIAQCRPSSPVFCRMVLTPLSFSDTKLPPRAAFTAQIIGTLFGAVLNFSVYLPRSYGSTGH